MDPQLLTQSETWKRSYPGAAIGILAMHNVANPEHHAGLDEHKGALEHEVRARFAGSDRAALKALPSIQPYEAYYKRFKKTYHVRLQLESILFKGKSIPRAAALVEAMFMTEIKNQLLTAGHDLETLELPLRIEVAEGTEHYVRINGEDQQVKSGDMMIADSQGIVSSILYGPAHRAQITPETRQAVFTVYAPPGIGEDAIALHLQDIQANVSLVAPDAEMDLLEVYAASEG